MPYVYPKNATLEQIEPDLIQALNLNADPIFRHLPIISKPAATIMWEISDAVTGLQGIRGYDGDPTVASRPGSKLYSMTPGVYGDFIPLSELELTTRGAGVMNMMPVDVSDLVADAQRTLLIRENTRIRSILWTMVRTGEIKVFGKDGTLLQRDSWSLRTFTAGVTWATHATATPFANFRAARAAWSGGTSCQFDETATAFMNRATCDDMLANTNSADLGSKLQIGELPDMDIVNRKLRALGLPTIVVMNDTYFDDNGAQQYYVPNNTVVIFGSRPANQPIGNYVNTLNAARPDGNSGGYTYVLNSAEYGKPVPPKIDVHRGHNGGPRILYPNGVGVMTV